MEDNKFKTDTKNAGELTKKAIQELVDEGQLEKKEEDYFWTKKGMIENQKHGLRTHDIFARISEKNEKI